MPNEHTQYEHTQHQQVQPEQAVYESIENFCIHCGHQLNPAGECEYKFCDKDQIMFCPSCGKKRDRLDVVFCLDCGQNFEDALERLEEKRKQRQELKNKQLQEFMSEKEERDNILKDILNTAEESEIQCETVGNTTVIYKSENQDEFSPYEPDCTVIESPDYKNKLIQAITDDEIISENVMENVIQSQTVSEQAPKNSNDKVQKQLSMLIKLAVAITVLLSVNTVITILKILS